MQPRLSPDSKWIMFEDGCRQYGPLLYKELYLTQVDRALVTQLTNFSDVQDTHTAEYAKAWLSDSSRVDFYTISCHLAHQPGKSQQRQFRLSR